MSLSLCFSVSRSHTLIPAFSHTILLLLRPGIEHDYPDEESSEGREGEYGSSDDEDGLPARRQMRMGRGGGLSSDEEDERAIYGGNQAYVDAAFDERDLSDDDGMSD